AELRPLLADALLSERAQQRGYFEPEVVRQMVEAHLERQHDYSFQLWSLLCLELWHREFVD
ncbi:MAG: asparagine synthetase B, partial [Chloroflexi bacterium]|nr:asparagine synthetase B [Chloroflexota bacterium]